MIDNHPETNISSLPDKRVRRTKDEINTLLLECQKIIANEKYQISIRHLYYRLFSMGLIENNPKSYANICHLLKKWRKSGDIDYDVFLDNTRQKIGVTTFDGIADALETIVDVYKRDMWETQDCYIEFWVEKDTVASIISRVARPLGVSTFICKGNASKTSLYEASKLFKEKQEQGKEIFIYYFGDFDPCGCNMDKVIQRDLLDDFDCENINFERLAIKPEQIEEYGLIMQALIKKVEYKKWTGGVVELDALSTDIIQTLVKNAIVRHINQDEWNKLKEVEKTEKERLQQIIENSKN